VTSEEDDDTTAITSKTRALREDAPDIVVGDEGEVSELVLEDIASLDDGEAAPLRVVAAGHSERGQRRKTNQDALLCLPEAEIFAVADGMGDRAGGQVASELVIEVLRRALVQGPLEGEADLLKPARADELVRAFEMANRAVHRRGLRDENFRGMGTTLTALCTAAGRSRAYVAHVGDSRCYRLRAGELTQLTRDHTRAELLGGVGPLAAELSRAVGIEPTVEIDLVVVEVAAGDRFLLCTDGLSHALDATAIAEGLAVADPAIAVEALVARANEGGGKDNITAVVVAVEDRAVE
jgi:PPM family protein phosphatase